MDQAELDIIARALGITPEEQGILDTGMDHPHGCRCETCWEWWLLVGPNVNGEYGPFTVEEMIADSPPKSV